ncbi:MAG TPA: hypothetical protein VGF70_05095 [Solirubrobacteraceae bacterium]|jgi:hypothetical protein
MPGPVPKRLMIFAADKISKVHALRVAIQMAGRRGERIERRLIRPRRLAHFRHCLGMLEERLAGSPLVGALRDQLTGLANELEAHTARFAIVEANSHAHRPVA